MMSLEQERGVARSPQNPPQATFQATMRSYQRDHFLLGSSGTLGRGRQFILGMACQDHNKIVGLGIRAGRMYNCWTGLD